NAHGALRHRSRPRGTKRGTHSMYIHRVLLAATTLAILPPPALALAEKPASPPAPSVSSPSKPATTGTSTAAVTAKVNLNTATAAQIEKLPKMTHVQSKAIVDARAKAKFKD